MQVSGLGGEGLAYAHLQNLNAKPEGSEFLSKAATTLISAGSIVLKESPKAQQA